MRYHQNGNCPEGTWDDPLTGRCIPEEERRVVQGRRIAVFGGVVAGAIYLSRRDVQ